MIVKNHLREDLLRYISRNFSDDERARFEERLLADQEFSDEAAQHEQELIDDYAVGRLSAEESASVRSWIEASAHRMQRVEMAKALLVRAPIKERKRRRIVFVLAAAACLVATAGVSLTLTKSYLRRYSKPAASETLAQVAPSAGAVSTSAANPQQPEIILLVAERIRGAQPIANYHISREAPLRLQILLSDDFAPSGYSLTILSLGPQQRVLVQHGNLKAQTKGKHAYLEATLSAGSLPPGKYRALVSNGESMLSADFSID